MVYHLYIQKYEVRDLSNEYEQKDKDLAQKLYKSLKG